MRSTPRDSQPQQPLRSKTSQVSTPTLFSCGTAFAYIQTHKSELGIGRDLDASDLHIEIIDLLANRVETEIGVGFFAAAMSALRKHPLTAALLVLGDMSVQGNIKPLRSLMEPLQVAKD